MSAKTQRTVIALVLGLIVLVGAAIDSAIDKRQQSGVNSANTQQLDDGEALAALEKLEVKGRAPKTGYSRKQFSDGWARMGNCDVRNYVLARDMTGVITRSETDCTVMQGTLQDPYTAKTIQFVRGPETSDDVQIDHVVAVSNAWQTGAQQLSAQERNDFYNDPLNLLAVEGAANNQKGDADAATWLPPNKDYRCRYAARQIAVKQKYRLWVTPAEKDALSKVLNTCSQQLLPVVNP